MYHVKCDSLHIPVSKLLDCLHFCVRCWTANIPASDAGLLTFQYQMMYCLNSSIRGCTAYIPVSDDVLLIFQYQRLYCSHSSVRCCTAYISVSDAVLLTFQYQMMYTLHSLYSIITVCSADYDMLKLPSLWLAIVKTSCHLPIVA